MLITIAGCDGIKVAPKLIEADGATYLACKDFVWIGTEGGGFLGAANGIKISFTDRDGLEHLVEGVKTLSVSDIPALVAAPMPYPLPGTDGVDSSGKPYVLGNVYTWADGTKAEFRGGAWHAVMQANLACEKAAQ